MYPETSGRPHSVRRSQPHSGTPERELALMLDGIVLVDREDQFDGSNYFLPELPGRDGRDFRHPVYSRES